MSQDFFLSSSSSREGLVEAANREESSKNLDVISTSDIMGDIEHALDYQDFDDSEQVRSIFSPFHFIYIFDLFQKLEPE